MAAGLLELFTKLADALSGSGTHGDHGCIFQKRPAHKLVDLKAHQFEDVGVYQVGLVENDDPLWDAQKAADVEVLARLWFDGLIRGDNEEDEVDAAGARQHIFDEPFMAGDVYKTDAQIIR